MDNVTHSLIGIAAAECLIATRTRKKLPRVPLWIASTVANNLPDLDVFFTMGRHRDKLDYLLHHRGYTHTLLLAPLQAVMLLAILRLAWWKRADIPWKEVSALSFLGAFLHLFADSWNSYGVHPFWPFDNRWYYGDLTFIVEPWLWVILLPLIWWRAESRIGQSIALLLLGAILAVGWFHDYVATPVAAATTLCSLLWLFAQRRIASDRVRLITAFSAITLVFGVLAAAQLQVKSRFVVPDREVAAVSHPGNPFCWTVLTAGFEGEVYRATAWTSAPWPEIVPARNCRNLFRGIDSQGVLPIADTATDERIPLGQFIGTRKEFRELTASCRARAFLRFARIPFWNIQDNRKQVGDLRFGGGRALSFAELSVAGAEEGCPVFEPPWIGRFFPSP